MNSVLKHSSWLLVVLMGVALSGDVDAGTDVIQAADDLANTVSVTVSGDDDGDNGHGNDDDGVDESNPGQGGGGPNG